MASNTSTLADYDKAIETGLGVIEIAKNEILAQGASS